AWCHGFPAPLPRASFFEDPPSPDRITATGESFTLVSLLRDTAAQDTAQNATGLTNVVFRGVRLAAPKGRLEFELHGVGRRVVGGMEVPYAVTVQGKWENGSQTYAAGLTTPLVAEAVPGSARVFGDDPSSHIVPKARLVRPSRKELDAFRRDAQLGAAANVVLEHPAGNPLLKVLPCPRFVPADRPPVIAQNARSVALAGQADAPPVRSDDASAVQAFLHAKDLYERLEAYGWTLPADYFRVMKPDLRILYRSGISPGPGKDGCTVNARVIPEGWPPNATGQPSLSDLRPAVYIHLASADLRRRERAPWTPGGV